MMKKEGYFGEYGGAFIPEVLQSTFSELNKAYQAIRSDASFWQEYYSLLQTYAGRPSPITYLSKISNILGGAQIYLKREDLNHTGSHKINNVLGQGLLVKHMGKKRVIAETGAGQHGFATAVMAARLGLECCIYMGEKDYIRQRTNVFWMEQLGAQVIPVKVGTKALKDALNEAFRDWSQNMATTHYVLGTACGPHPFPEMVTWFQSVISQESKEQIQDIAHCMPSRVYACVGGGSNSLGSFYHYLENEQVKLIGVEAGGKGKGIGQHAARLALPSATTGVCQGYKTKFLQNEEGQMMSTYSISSGLDYIGVSPILAHLHETKRVRFEAATDEETLQALGLLMKEEGIIAALESAHALAIAFQEAKKSPKDQVFLVTLSGRGDKDIFNIAEALEDSQWEQFITDKAKEYSVRS